MKTKETLITIITPTYNRAYLLPKLFQSLKKQTKSNFEWVVIDDGSTDNTKAIVTDFSKQKTNFAIRYFYQENGGKHRALNVGINKAAGDFCFIVDSDDYLDDRAIEQVISWVKNLPANFAGVAGLRVHSDGTVIGGCGVNDCVDATNLERRKYNLLGDKAEVYRTTVLRKYPFPELQGENFLSEAVVWNKIAEDGYKIRWYSQPIYYCEYLDDGLTKNVQSKHKQNPKGYTLYIKQLIKHEPLFIKKAILAGLYNREVYGYHGIVSTARSLNMPIFSVVLGTLIRRVLKK